MAGSKAKEAARALVAGAETPKQQVAAAAEKNGKLEGSGAGIKVASRSDPNYGELQWIVSEHGIIRAWNRDNALEVTITPALQSGKASWNCRGYPADAMPPACGGKT